MQASDAANILKSMEARILALNNMHAAELSLLNAARLSVLIERAFYARQVDGGAAFIIAFDERADYDSPNYLWFRQRYTRFVYVDRIAVKRAARGQRLARRLYSDLIATAASAGHTVILCEVNSDPPNPESDALHAGLGFAEVGKAEIHGGTKTVRYLARTI